MKQNKIRRIIFSMYAVAFSVTMLTGFTSYAAENNISDILPAVSLAEDDQWMMSDTAGQICEEMVTATKAAAGEAHQAYVAKVEEEKRKAEEARRLAEKKAGEEAAAKAARQADQELLAALIFCEAGNQPYEGQVAVGAVVMNRVKSGSYPDTIEDVIYQSGQFGPAMTGWLDSVLARDGYTDSAMQAAADAMAGSNPVGDCLYFGNGNWGLKIGDHYFH